MLSFTLIMGSDHRKGAAPRNGATVRLMARPGWAQSALLTCWHPLVPGSMVCPSLATIIFHVKGINLQVLVLTVSGGKADPRQSN